jgi:hypothetical protein
LLQVARKFVAQLLVDAFKLDFLLLYLVFNSSDFTRIIIFLNRRILILLERGFKLFHLSE